MSLLSARIDDLRCLRHVEIELDPALTLIHGPNGSGKSSLLEALFLLGRGRSFRTARSDTLIRHGAGRLQVVGQVESFRRRFPIGIEVRARKTLARIDGEPARSLAALSTALPVQIIEPGIHKLIEEGPIRRRRYVDWGVFHVEPRYLEQWQRFHRGVHQRNAALRAHAADEELDSWDEEFVETATEVTRARQTYVEALEPYVVEIAAAFLPYPVELQYTAGFSFDEPLALQLRAIRPRDRQRRTSTLGPHRADLIVRTQGHLARDQVSRGQQKLLAAALFLGQLRYHTERFNMKSTLLLDDPAAELDARHLEQWIQAVSALRTQVVVTALRPDFQLLGAPGRVFHVEQGTVAPV